MTDTNSLSQSDMNLIPLVSNPQHIESLYDYYGHEMNQNEMNQNEMNQNEMNQNEMNQNEMNQNEMNLPQVKYPELKYAIDTVNADNNISLYFLLPEQNNLKHEEENDNTTIKTVESIVSVERSFNIKEPIRTIIAYVKAVLNTTNHIHLSVNGKLINCPKNTSLIYCGINKNDTIYVEY
jgi:hypothetical protein